MTVSLGAQRCGELVVGGQELTELILAVRGQRHAEIAFAIACHHARQGTKDLPKGPRHTHRQPEHHGYCDDCRHEPSP
jgi:hypothetical protein